ncbi:fibroblast growth factor receptor 1-like [Eriocheir sinensis]|uniref:fibroblast growth factor receptor 1-like n=1 Tax=Eriocheir sinensis TaxID=95602 RepID=UPI0021C6C44F|nr:fibroblast growth factor receptor 1-like [Eriocheir sinensis]
MFANTTAYVGRRADLHCRVHSLGNRRVVWIRSRDLHILTVDQYTFTTDERFQAVHQPGTNQWTLRISSALPRDRGAYECHVTTKPIMSATLYLEVLEPHMEILGSPDLYVQKASTINLTCVLYNLPEPPANVLWYHKHKNLSYISSRGGVAVMLDKGPNTTTSHLLILSATAEDSGAYTCAPADLSPISVRVHVLDGEEPAAMQKNNTAPLTAPTEEPPPMTTKTTNSSMVSSASERLMTTTSLLLLSVGLELLGGWCR